MLNKLKEMRESREEGFTLIELLVVIVIIGVLAAIALPIFLNQQKAAIAAGVKSDVRNTVTAVSTFLVKKPTATTAELAFTVKGTTAPATPAAVANTNIDVKSLSDDATYIVVAGAWDTYTVTGKNAGVSASYTYAFNSTTGKYTETA